MKNPSVNSIVERLEPCPFCGPGNSIVECYQDDYGYWKVGCGACGSHSGIRPKSDPDGRAKVVAHWNTRPAATIISELQAEVLAINYHLVAAQVAGLDLGSSRPLSSAVHDLKKRAEAAESSLSRIKAETIEECAKVAEAKAVEFLSPEYATGQPLSSFNERFACEQVASAIRSLGSTGGAEKTAESEKNAHR